MEDTDNSTEIQNDVVKDVETTPVVESEPQVVTEQPEQTPLVLHKTENDEPVVTPSKIAGKMYIDHFSVIMNKIAIFTMVVSILIMIGQIVAMFAAGIGMLILIMFLLVITICTLGIVLLDPTIQRLWGYVQHFDEITDTIKQVFDFLYFLLPYISSIGIVCAIISIVCFSTNKSFQHPTRKVMAIIAIVILALAFVFGLRVVGGAA